MEKPPTPEAPTQAYVESYFLSGTLLNGQFYLLLAGMRVPISTHHHIDLDAPTMC